ncbi:MAG: DUF4007 family protein [Bacillota bacterium]
MGQNSYNNTFSQQGFNLEIPYILKLIKVIEKKEDWNKKELSSLMGVGVPKIRCFIDYAKIANLLNANNKITNFGKSMLEIEYNYDYLYSLLYYQFVKDTNQGGHLYFSKIVNEILYNVSFQLNNKISINEIKESMLDYNIRGIKKEYHFDYTARAIRTLTDAATGFGKLGMVKEVKDGYEVYSYWPEPLVCAYIIYDRWEEGRVAMKIDDIVNGNYNFGRIFFLDEDRVMGILEDLQQLDYIEVETIAGLNQISINPKLSKADILEAIVDET